MVFLVAKTSCPKSLSSVSSTRPRSSERVTTLSSDVRGPPRRRQGRHSPERGARGQPRNRNSRRPGIPRPGETSVTSRSQHELFVGETVSAAYAKAARIPSRVRCGYASSTSASVAPSLNFRTTKSTVIRVPRMTGLPSMTAGSREMIESVMDLVPLHSRSYD